MLRVTAILEGGLNLETGEEIPRSIVVSNGARSVTVPIPESKIQELAEMFALELQNRSGPQVAVAPAPAVVMSTRMATNPVRVTKPLFEPEPEAPPALTLDEPQFQPGEDYEESGTGVASL